MGFSKGLVSVGLMMSLLSVIGCTGAGTDTASDFPSIDGGTGTGGGGTTFPSDDPIAVTASTSPLYIKVETKYAGEAHADLPSVTHGYCYIDPANLAANSITCNISIPEGWLYYSDTSVSVGTGNRSLCPRVEFYPYFYQIANSSVTLPGDDDVTDCGATPMPVKCWGGAAIDMIEGFPKSAGIWFATDKISQSKLTAKSAWEHSTRSNRHICNNLTNKVANRTGYVGNSMRDYIARCHDPYQGTLFQIRMVIADEDTVNAETDTVNDEFNDWGP